jgi:hypothetical protein
MLTSFRLARSKSRNPSGWRFQEFLFPILVLAILLLYSLSRFYLVSYLGFQYNSNTGEVTQVHVQSASLAEGETIRAVNDVPWDDTRQMSVRELTVGPVGSIAHLSIEGEDGALRDVAWVIPGFNTSEFLSRLLNSWVLAYFFWLVGTATVLLVRPKNDRWALLAAFNFITAIWFIAGSISYSGVLESARVLRFAVWLSLPIYWHLHWNFPQPLGRLPAWAWVVFYLGAFLGGIANWIGWLHYDIYTVIFLLAILGSIFMLLYRFLRRPAERNDVRLLFIAAFVALLPSAALALSSAQDDFSVAFAGSVLSLVALPSTYFYVVYRRQLGGLDVRANRLIALYLFLVLVMSGGLLAFPVLFSLLPGLQQAGGAIIFTALVTSIVTVFGFERFQRFVERKLLRIPGAPQRVLEDFAERISTSFSRENLASVLASDVLPSFLVRQSALLDFDLGLAQKGILYSQGLSESETASLDVHTRNLLADWVNVSLPLSLNGNLRGLWLLGRKDPDDYYSEAELNQLRSLAAQTSIALANISQAESLRALHQADIERQETERIHLARELHDDTLRRVNDLGNLVSDDVFAGRFGIEQKALVGQVRRLMSGLRPPLLDQGLYYALLQLKEDLEAKADGLSIQLEIRNSPGRLQANIEQHLFRIVQQAAENALKHSKAKTLWIRGTIDPVRTEIGIEDDGAGFAFEGKTSLALLLTNRHFGLAGIYERAAMIQASLDIVSRLGEGTKLIVIWKAK